MSVRIVPIQSSAMRTLLPTISSAVQSFISSTSNFRVIRTVSPSTLSSLSSSTSAPHTSTLPLSSPAPAPKTLFILDSSYNPPSHAHLSIALSALRNVDLQACPKPHRLVLLFSTHNADKSPSPAAFEHRASLMTMFAIDLLERLKASSPSISDVDIDVGLTDKPYYTDKTSAIAASNLYKGPDAAGSEPTHVHLAGYDTFTRIFTAKYYPEHHPPLSALAPYFDAGHRLRITMRLEDDFGDVKQQKGYLEGIRRGDMEAEGGKREWGYQVELVEEGKDAVGVSSTNIRKAIAEGRWAEAEALTTSRVYEWVREFELYTSSSG